MKKEIAVKAVSLTIVAILSLSMASCLKDSAVQPSANESRSGLSITMSMKDAPKDVASIVGILTRQGYDTLKNNFTVSVDSAVCEFDNVAVGVWHLQVNAYDGTNALKYSGSTNVEVFAGQTTPVSLVLNSTTGSITITVTWGPGKAGNALSLDGQSGYLEVPNSASLSFPDTAITLEAWVKPAEQYYNTVIAKGSYNYLIEFTEGLYPGIILSGVTFDSTAPNYWGRLMILQDVPADQWTHVAVTYSQPTGLRVYFNGQLVYEGPGSGHISTGTLPLRIGARVDSAYTEYFKGQIDEVRIWYIVRSQSDISTNMTKELTGTENGLLAYYKFDEGIGSTIIHDATSNHNDGQLHGNSAVVSSTAF